MTDAGDDVIKTKDVFYVIYSYLKFYRIVDSRDLDLEVIFTGFKLHVSVIYNVSNWLLVNSIELELNNYSWYGITGGLEQKTLLRFTSLVDMIREVFGQGFVHWGKNSWRLFYFPFLSGLANPFLKWPQAEVILASRISFSLVAAMLESIFLRRKGVNSAGAEGRLETSLSGDEDLVGLDEDAFRTPVIFFSIVEPESFFSAEAAEALFTSAEAFLRAAEAFLIRDRAIEEACFLDKSSLTAFLSEMYLILSLGISSMRENDATCNILSISPVQSDNYIKCELLCYTKTLEIIKCWKNYLTDPPGAVFEVAVQGVRGLHLADVVPGSRLVLDADLAQWYLPSDARPVREIISITCPEHLTIRFSRKLDFEIEGMRGTRLDLQLRLHCSVLETMFEFPGLSLTAARISPYLTVIYYPMTSVPAASRRSMYRENNGTVGCLNLNLNVIINETPPRGYSGILETYYVISIIRTLYFE